MEFILHYHVARVYEVPFAITGHILVCQQHGIEHEAALKDNSRTEHCAVMRIQAR